VPIFRQGRDLAVTIATRGSLGLAKTLLVSLALIGWIRAEAKAAGPDDPPALPAHPKGVRADDIPVAHTPPGGYGNTFPPPVLATCTEPLARGAPDLRGIWKTVRAERGGRPVAADDRLHHYVERIEQCGNRIVDMGGGTIADARADGTAENGVHDVSAFDYTTPIHVVASYEDDVFVLRPLLVSMIRRFVPVTIPWSWFPVGVPGFRVTRKLDDDGHMVWTRPDLGGLEVTLRRIGGPNDPYTRTDLPSTRVGGRE
jgi:hypothetical protein